LKAQVSKVTALRTLGQQRKALELCRDAEKLAVEIGRPYQTHLVGLELDRLNDDLESARTRMQWFEERGLLNGVNIAKRYFPEFAEVKQTSKFVESAVRLEVLGTLQAKKDTVIPIRGRKRQELLALLLEAKISGRSEVSRLTLFDSLYPDDDELKAGSSLKVVIHNLRETLGENAMVML
jgi:hypothetical protein